MAEDWYGKGIHQGWSVRGKYSAKGDPYWMQMFLDYANNMARAEFKYPGSMFRISKEGRLYLTPQFMHMFGTRLSRSFVDVIRKAGTKAAFKSGMMAVAFAAAVDVAKGEDKAAITEANQQIAAAMRSAIVMNYGAVIGRKVQVPSYRVGRNRYAGGALKNALGNADLAVGDKDGVKYINQDRLNIEARHWARMNWGVAPATTPPSWQGKLVFADQPIGNVGFHVSPRPPMFMPAGFWDYVGGKISSGPLVNSVKYTRRYHKGAGVIGKNPKTGEIFIARGGTLSGPRGNPSGEYQVQAKRGSQPAINRKHGWRENYGSYRKSGIRVSRQGFYPLDKSPRYPTRGIVGVNIFDWGLKAMVKEFEYRYEMLVRKWVDGAYRSTKASTGAAGRAFMATLDLDPKNPGDVLFIEKAFIDVRQGLPQGKRFSWE